MLHGCYKRWSAGLLFCIVLLIGGCGSDSDAEQTQATALQLPDFTTIVKEVEPAVVNISALPMTPDSDAEDSDGTTPHDWLRRFFGQDEPGELPHFAPQPSLGSGFIISDDGYILTNRHVVSGSGSIVVKLADRKQLSAEVIGTDKYSDVALLKVDATQLPTVNIGDPEVLEVGSWVLAIGSPFGFETSVTAGIVSAKGRNLASEQYVPFIQTDVAINPGNSGGPLFNLDGEVVGVNAQIYTRTGGYQGVSFAIPINIAMNVAQQLKVDGRVERGWLGVQIQEVTRELAENFDMDQPRGALVARVFEGSPADAAGLQTGDVILTFNDQEIDTVGELPPLVATIEPGEKAVMSVLRDGRKGKFAAKIGTLPEDLVALEPHAAPEPEAEEQTNTSQGLTLEQLTPAERAELGEKQRGVRIIAMQEGAGADAGLQRGDIILAVGEQPIDAPATFVELMAEIDGPVDLLVSRDGARLYLVLRPED